MVLRRGFIFTLDALLAVVLIVGAIMMYVHLQGSSRAVVSPQSAAEDILLSLDAITLADLEPSNPWVPGLYDTGLSEDDSVLYAIAYLRVLDDARSDDLAAIAKNVTPRGMSLTLRLDNQVLVEENEPTTGRMRAVARQQVTGIEWGRPVAGTSSTAYLRKLSDKRTNAFAYFGGFVGQGNISVKLDLPADVDSSRITAVDLELDTPESFDLYINDQLCGAFTPSTANMTPDRWDISSCSDSLGPGTNTVNLTYDDVNGAYVAGGFVKVSFTTDEFVTSGDLTRTRYDFPGVRGIVNLYDAFIVPETLNSLKIRLHYVLNEPNTTAYLAVGEKIVWSSNRTGEVDEVLDDVNLTILDYALLSNKTVPIRFSAFNYTTRVYRGGDADVVVITDYSGSMKKATVDWSQGDSSGQVTDCEGTVYGEPTIRRQIVARCLGKEVVQVLFNETGNITGNRLWPVYYFRDEIFRYTNPEDDEALIGHYETGMPPQGDGQTCIACALNEAHAVFTEYDEPDRKRYVILLSDGLPTHEAQGTTASYLQPEACAGVCDTAGQQACDQSDYGSLCLAPSQCSPAIEDARSAAQRLKDDYNTTIFTVGIGPVEACDQGAQILRDIAILSNGTYQNASDPQLLRDIYVNISRTILEEVLLDAQAASVAVAGSLTTSILEGDSYILATHDAPTNPPLANEIEVTRQSPQFGTLPGGPCAPLVPLPGEVRFRDARVVSYSGANWTDLVRVNDTTVHNLSDFLVRYARLGDPYLVNVPVELLSDSNQLTVRVGEEPVVSGGCSANNSLIYTAYVPSATARTPVLENATGCRWTIETDDGSTLEAVVPKDYAGAQTCSYTRSGPPSYDESDAMHVAVYQLLDQLDFDDDGAIFVSLVAEDLEIIVTKVSSVPYLWGPIIMTAEVEQ